MESLYKEAKAVMAPIRKGLVRILKNRKWRNMQSGYKEKNDIIFNQTPYKSQKIVHKIFYHNHLSNSKYCHRHVKMLVL